jgi:hypothetical protein
VASTEGLPTTVREIEFVHTITSEISCSDSVVARVFSGAPVKIVVER